MTAGPQPMPHTQAITHHMQQEGTTMPVQPRQTPATNPTMPEKITTPGGIDLHQQPNWYDGNRAVYKDDQNRYQLVPQYRNPTHRPPVAAVRLSDATITRHASIREALAAIDAQEATP